MKPLILFIFIFATTSFAKNKQSVDWQNDPGNLEKAIDQLSSQIESYFSGGV